MPKPDNGNEDDKDRTEYWAVPTVRPDDPIPGLASADSASTALPPSSGLYSALNTLLLDDSALKAHLQPYNHLTLPEYTPELRSRDVKRRTALDEVSRPIETNMADEGTGDDSEDGDTAHDTSAGGQSFLADNMINLSIMLV
jgi:hypothetical protein